MILRTIHVKRHERALEFRRGDFHALLAPGTYRRPVLVDVIRRITVERVNTLVCKFEHRLLDV